MFSIFVVGLLFDATMYYPSSFYFGGAVIILGALVMVPAAIKERKVKISKTEPSTMYIFSLCESDTNYYKKIRS